MPVGGRPALPPAVLSRWEPVAAAIHHAWTPAHRLVTAVHSRVQRAKPQREP